MLRFDEAKATEATALFLRLRGGQMHYMKLIKLLYLADRIALQQWGIPITTDSYVSMDHGPVVSTIYDLIRGRVEGPTWKEYITPPMGDGGKEVALVRPPKLSRLSRAEEGVIKEVFDQYGKWNRYKLRDFVMHRLPEWQDPEGTLIPIRIADILSASGTDQDEIRAIEKELNTARIAEDSFVRSGGISECFSAFYRQEFNLA
jgi:uncharacterized phage-associated protein